MRISGFTSFEGIGIEDCDNFFQVSRTDANLRVERKLQWRTHLARDRKAQVSGAFLVDGEDCFKQLDTLGPRGESEGLEGSLGCDHGFIDVRFRSERDGCERIFGRRVDDGEIVSMDRLHPGAVNIKLLVVRHAVLYLMVVQRHWSMVPNGIHMLLIV